LSTTFFLLPLHLTRSNGSVPINRSAVTILGIKKYISVIYFSYMILCHATVFFSIPEFLCPLLYTLNIHTFVARGTVVGWASMLQAGRSWVRVPMRWNFLIDLILPGALWSWGRPSLY
jgi:hypothetical protein